MWTNTTDLVRFAEAGFESGLFHIGNSESGEKIDRETMEPIYLSYARYLANLGQCYTSVSNGNVAVMYLYGRYEW